MFGTTRWRDNGQMPIEGEGCNMRKSTDARPPIVHAVSVVHLGHGLNMVSSQGGKHSLRPATPLWKCRQPDGSLGSSTRTARAEGYLVIVVPVCLLGFCRQRYTLEVPTQTLGCAYLATTRPSCYSVPKKNEIVYAVRIPPASFGLAIRVCVSGLGRIANSFAE